LDDCIGIILIDQPFLLLSVLGYHDMIFYLVEKGY